jgi:hypothetical protein
LFQQDEDVENKTPILSKDLRFFTGYKMASESSTQSKTEIDSKQTEEQIKLCFPPSQERDVWIDFSINWEGEGGGGTGHSDL